MGQRDRYLVRVYEDDEGPYTILVTLPDGGMVAIDPQDIEVFKYSQGWSPTQKTQLQNAVDLQVDSPSPDAI